MRAIQGYCNFAVIYYLASHRDVHCEILLSNLSVLIYITPVVVLVCYICDTYSRFFCANFSLPLFILWLMSVSTSWVLWCEPKTIRNQFFVLFRKYNKTIVNDILRITSKRKKMKAARNSLLLGNVCNISCFKNRTTHSQG